MTDQSMQVAYKNHIWKERTFVWIHKLVKQDT